MERSQILAGCIIFFSTEILCKRLRKWYEEETLYTVKIITDNVDSVHAPASILPGVKGN